MGWLRKRAIEVVVPLRGVERSLSLVVVKDGNSGLEGVLAQDIAEMIGDDEVFVAGGA